MTDRRPWAVWAVLSMVLFAVIEAYAIASRRVATLSATCTVLPRIVIFGIGVAVGVLVIHFWGDGWCP